MHANIIPASIFAVSFCLIAIAVLTRKYGRKQLSLASNVAPKYEQMLSTIAARHQETRRFPIRNERQEEHYIKASLAAMHAAYFHDNG